VQPITPRNFTTGRLLVPRPRSRFTVALWYALFGVLFLLAEGCAGLHGPNKTAPKGPTRGSPFTATAYCTGRVTASGTAPTAKTVAADPAVLPLGSHIRLTGLDKRYDGVYVVRDTGARVRGRRIDLYIRDCHEAVGFGRRSATVSLLH
jgi:3D (Asp-Asp-Asp) domain-containing protein